MFMSFSVPRIVSFVFLWMMNEQSRRTFLVQREVGSPTLGIVVTRAEEYTLYKAYA